MWSLTSARAKRIGGPKKFRSCAEKDFFQHYLPKPEVGTWILTGDPRVEENGFVWEIVRG